jgi:hypothetical protein
VEHDAFTSSLLFLEHGHSHIGDVFLKYWSHIKIYLTLGLLP